MLYFCRPTLMFLLQYYIHTLIFNIKQSISTCRAATLAISARSSAFLRASSRL